MSYQERVLVMVLIIVLVCVVLAALADKFDRSDRERDDLERRLGTRKEW